MALAYELPWSVHTEIAAHCLKRGIVYCASCFEPSAVDLLVKNGGTAILSETPEIYGAEHMLLRRAVSWVGR